VGAQAHHGNRGRVQASRRAEDRDDATGDQRNLERRATYSSQQAQRFLSAAGVPRPQLAVHVHSAGTARNEQPFHSESEWF